ncbi:MAG: DUF362 domain-containing protein [Phycisphaerae bacterium]|nr:DUF362 domain-containing protein [Phycisphaerae bacterium]
MIGPTVALTRCQGYDRQRLAECLRRQFDLLGVSRLVRPGQRVLLKPNLIAPSPAEAAVQTHPAVIVEVARLVQDLGATPLVGDSPAWGTIASCAKAMGLDAALRAAGVRLCPLKRPRSCRLGDGRAIVSISSVALDADVVINLPKFKAHQQLLFTFAVKNVFGCVCGKRKPYWHFARGGSPEEFCEFLIQVYQIVRPAVTIIDGITAMEGPGPIRGRAKPLGWLIGGADPIACERICARLVAVDPERVPLIRTAERIGFGCGQTDEVVLLGDDPEEGICTDLVLPPQIPIRFSLARVVQSVAKGLLGATVR